MAELHGPSNLDMEEDCLTQKCGYLEIKQSSKVRTRKLKVRLFPTDYYALYFY